jgi:hypothetical protein
LDEQRIFEMLGRLDERTGLILEQTQKTNGRVTRLESRVDVLEAKDDTSAGAKAVKKTVLASCWDVGKIILAAIIGGAAGKLLK